MSYTLKASPHFSSSWLSLATVAPASNVTLHFPLSTWKKLINRFYYTNNTLWYFTTSESGNCKVMTDVWCANIFHLFTKVIMMSVIMVIELDIFQQNNVPIWYNSIWDDIVRLNIEKTFLLDWITLYEYGNLE